MKLSGWASPPLTAAFAGHLEQPMSKAIRVHVIERPDEWLSAVAGFHPEIGKPGFGCFRGARGLRRGLVPSAFRHPPPICEGEDRWLAQLRAELFALRTFSFKSDEAGLPLPRGITPWQVAAVVQTALAAPVPTFPIDLLEVAALAQHYGCPTRLLDFTHNPLVAAFFAAHSAFCAELADRPNEPDMVVWRAHPELYYAPPRPDLERTPREHARRYYYPLYRVDLPYAANSRMHEQQGTFLTPHPAPEYRDGAKEFTFGPTDWTELPAPPGAEHAFEAFTTAAEHCSEVLWLLESRYGIHETRLFRDYGAAALAASRGWTRPATSPG